MKRTPLSHFLFKRPSLSHKTVTLDLAVIQASYAVLKRWLAVARKLLISTLNNLFLCQHCMSSSLAPLTPSGFSIPLHWWLCRGHCHCTSAPFSCAASAKIIICHTGPHFNIASDQHCTQCFKGGLDRLLVTLKSPFPFCWQWMWHSWRASPQLCPTSTLIIL